MMERGRPLPPKIARSTTRAANRHLTGRLYRLRHLELHEGPLQSGSN